jgi:hypothetical protein
VTVPVAHHHPVEPGLGRESREHVPPVGPITLDTVRDAVADDALDEVREHRRVTLDRGHRGAGLGHRKGELADTGGRVEYALTRCEVTHPGTLDSGIRAEHHLREVQRVHRSVLAVDGLGVTFAREQFD